MSLKRQFPMRPVTGQWHRERYPATVHFKIKRFSRLRIMSLISGGWNRNILIKRA